MKGILLGILAIFFIQTRYALASEAHLHTDMNTFDRCIEQAYQWGEIDYDTALLNKAFALFDPSRVDSQFLHSPLLPEKCGTPVLREIRRNWNKLRSETMEILMVYLQRVKPTELTYNSPGGHFKLHYAVAGQDAVPLADTDGDGVPDYIEKAASYFDYCWSIEVDSLGYLSPPSDEGYAGDDRYDIFFENMFCYGYTIPISDTLPSSYIVIENDFRGFPSNDDPEGNRWGALKVTAAHEFFHACQFVYDLAEAIWFSEVTAVWMEEMAFDIVNDYYNYLPGFFSHPEKALDEGFAYEKVLWGLYLSQNFGVSIIRAVWVECGTVMGDNALFAHYPVFQNHGTTLEETFKGFSVWNYLTGARANDTHPHYEEASFYPQVEKCDAHTHYPVIDHPGCPLDHLGASYVIFSEIDQGNTLELSFEGQTDYHWGACVIIEEDSGPSVQYSSIELVLNGGDTGKLPFQQADQYTQLVLVPSLLSPEGRDVPYSYSAVFFQPLTIDHTPLEDTQETTRPYVVTVAVSPLSVLDTSSVRLHYGFGTGTPVSFERKMIMTDQFNIYQAEIPGQSAGNIVNYYFSAIDTAGRGIIVPKGAPDSLYSFSVYPDTIPPVVNHFPHPWISVDDFPLGISAFVTDSYGPAVVKLFYKKGSMTEEDGIDMTLTGELSDEYVGVISDSFEVGDTLLYRIKALDASPQTNIAWNPEVGCHIIEVRETSTVEIHVDLGAGWNLVSLPVIPDDDRVAVLFPDNVGAWGWDGNDHAYVEADVFEIGYGYWLAMLEPQTAVLSGRSVTQYTREIVAGWNMVGSIALETDTSAFEDSPGGIILPQSLVWYNPVIGTYRELQIVYPGLGYWLASLGAGTVTLSERMPGASTPSVSQESSSFPTITITHEGKSQVLQFGFDSEATDGFDVSIDRPVPPPSPWSDDFDAYFSIDHEIFNRFDRDIRPVGSTPVWELVVECESGVIMEWDISTIPSDMDVIMTFGNRIVDMRSRKFLRIDVASRLRISVDKDLVVPRDFGLSHIYPNPFNPMTTIQFSLTDSQSPSNISLKIYNVLGQEIKTFVDGMADPGTYSVVWDGTDDMGFVVPSGVYFIRIESGKRYDVRKMVLLK